MTYEDNLNNTLIFIRFDNITWIDASVFVFEYKNAELTPRVTAKIAPVSIFFVFLTLLAFNLLY